MQKPKDKACIKMRYLPVVFIILLFYGCSGGGSSGDTINSENNPIGNDAIQGNIQKGPFISGSTVTINALGNNLDQTGRVFNTTTTDDFGTFSLSESIKSKYADIYSTGFYFNEVTGKLSDAYITLRALSDVTQGNTINVNILTTLEIKRVYYLIKEEGKSFADAKKQAEKEILSIFNIHGNDDINNFEKLDISKEGNGNAILLAITAILQGSNTEAELSELISKISLDIEKDGTLDNAIYINEIQNNASALDLMSIRENLKERYESLGLQVTIPDFEAYTKRLLPLEVVRTIPSSSQIDINFMNPGISIFFNQEMNEATLNNETVQLKNGDSLINCALSYDKKTLKTSIIPSDELLPSTVYTISLSSQIKSLSGNSLSGPISWSFKTMSLDLSNNLVFNFSLDGNYSDISGNNYIVVPNNTFFVADRFGSNTKACGFNYSSFVRLPDGLNLLEPNWTYSIWFRIDSFNDSWGEAFLLGFNPNNSHDYAYGFLKVWSFLGSYEPRWGFIGFVTDPGEESFIYYNVLSPGVWYHASLTYEQGLITFYLNGDKVLESTSSFKHALDASAQYFISTQTDPCGNRRFSGSVDDVLFYRRALNECEVKMLYMGGL